MSSILSNPETFLKSFKDAGGWYDPEVFGLLEFDQMGWGAVALKDIEEHTPLFHIPLRNLLTPYTSELRSKLSSEEWESLGGGWSKLILVMMYETERGKDSPWCSYLESMPREFSTPMFWSEEERKALKGTDIEERIGKDQAEEEYYKTIEPLLKAHPELFPADSSNFCIESFHIQGSRILSRSFTIPLSRSDPSSSTTTKPSTKTHNHGGEEHEDSDEEGDEEEEEEEIAVMVPMADMLNAAYERDNARLFGDDDDDAGEAEGEVLDKLGEGYTMISTKNIKKGEQIFNTYASPPNSELLRKYGHVDQYPLPEEVLSLLEADEVGDYPTGNPGDEVVIEGDRILAAAHAVTGKSESKLQERAEWWIEEGQDDSFAFAYDDEVEPGLVAFVRLLVFDFEWSRAQKKGKLPTTMLDKKVGEVLEKIISDREAGYGQTIQDDLDIIKASKGGQGSSLINAAIVRLGEKRVLKVARRAVQTEVKKQGVTKAEDDDKKKRKGESGRGARMGKMKLS